MMHEDLLGKPFQYHATGPDAYDCKGLVAEISRRRGIPFPHYDSSSNPAEQHAAFLDGLQRHTVRLDQPEPWCLVMFCVRPPWVSHCGIVLPDLYQFIHVMRGVNVCVERLDSMEWQRRVRGFYRLVAP